MWFIAVVVKNLWRRKVRSLLTCVSLAVAVCAVVAMLGTAEGYESAFGQLFEARGADLVVIRAGLAQRISSSLPESLADELKTLHPKVDKVEPILVDMVIFGPLVGVYLFGLRPDGIAMEQMKPISGHKLKPGDRRQVALGDTLATNLDKKVGEEVTLYGVPFEIVGIYQSYNVLESNGAVVLLKDLQEAMGRPAQVTTFLVQLHSAAKKGKDVEEVCAAIEKMDSYQRKPIKLSAKSTRDHVRSTFELQVLSSLAWASSTLALIIGIVSMLNTMMMSVSERIREIATLRAIGWKRRRILRMILLEALLLSVVASCAGVLLAWPLMHFLANYQLTSTVVVTTINLPILTKSVGLGILAGLLGAFYPAFIATRLSPGLALRHD